MPNIYIAGPMTGYDEFNYPAFHAMGDILIDNGYVPLSGAHTHFCSDPRKSKVKPPHPDHTRPYEDYLRYAISELMYADGIIFLDNADQSPGAQLERRIAAALRLTEYHIVDNNTVEAKTDPLTPEFPAL